MASELARKKCVPCGGGVKPLTGQAVEELKQKLGGDWQVVDENHLEKNYKFKDYKFDARLRQPRGHDRRTGESPPRHLLHLGQGEGLHHDAQDQRPVRK